MVVWTQKGEFMTPNQKIAQHKYYTQNPKGVYIRQAANARRRGIPWEFTFDTWWEVWQNSGKWNERGRGKDTYCMARRRDQGSYRPDNVVIIPFGRNSQISVNRNKIWAFSPRNKKEFKKLLDSDNV